MSIYQPARATGLLNIVFAKNNTNKARAFLYAPKWVFKSKARIRTNLAVSSPILIVVLQPEE